MSYHYEQNANGGYFISSITHKRYPFVHDAAHIDRKRAENQMNDDVAIIKAQLAHRLGHEPSLRELQRGIDGTDSRSLRERIQADALKASSRPPRDLTKNPYLARYDEVEKQNALTPEQKGQRARRLAMLEIASLDWEKKRAEEVAYQEECARISGDVADADAGVTLARYGTGYTSEDVRITESLREDLMEDHDLEKYRKNRNAFEASVRARREECAAQFEQRAREEKELAALIRSGEVSTEEVKGEEPPDSDPLNLYHPEQ